MSTILSETTGPSYAVRGLDHAVTIMPDERREAAGVYSDRAAALVKELKAIGVDAAFYDRGENRVWRALLGEDAALQLVIGVVSGLISTAAWAGLTKILVSSLGAGRRVQIKFLREERQKNGSKTRTWLEYNGKIDDLGHVWRELKGGDGE